MPNHRLSAVVPERELDRQLAPPRMSRETPIPVSSESDSPIAVTITSNSESAQTISSDRNPDVALVSGIITVPEEDDQRSDTIEHVDFESDDLEVLGAKEFKGSLMSETGSFSQPAREFRCWRI